MTNKKPSTSSSPFGWKALILAFIFGGVFLLFFYLAVNDHPDYMRKSSHTHENHQVQTGHSTDSSTSSHSGHN